MGSPHTLEGIDGAVLAGAMMLWFVFVVEIVRKDIVDRGRKSR